MRNESKLGPYELVSLLGSGGMAEVFLARKSFVSGQDKLFALKKTLPDYLDSPELQKMFFEEMKLAACLNHKNIVQTIDFGIIDSQTYFVMELIHGISLRELIGFLRDSGEELPVPMVLFILKQVLDALEYAYQVCDPETGKQLQLIHRDISPHNIMLTYEGEVKVIDFGIAKVSVAAQQTQHGVLKGKIAYMSPEQANGVVIDARSDLFSVGIIVWELLMNRRFFHGSSADEVKRSVRFFRFENVNLDESPRLQEVKGILSQLLHHDRSKRYGNAKEASKAISYFLNKEYPQFSQMQIAAFLKTEFKDKYQESIEKIRRAKSDSILQPLEKTAITIKSFFSKPKIKPLIITPVIRRKKVVSANSRLPFTFAQFLVFCLVMIAGYSLYDNSKILYKKALAIHARYSPKPVLQELVEVEFQILPSDAKFSMNGLPVDTKSAKKLILKKGQAYQLEVFKEGYVGQSFKFYPAKNSSYQVALQRLPNLQKALELVSQKKQVTSPSVATAPMKKKKNRSTASK